MSVRVAVLGARGQLGAAVVQETSPRHDVVAFTHAALDVTDDRAVGKALATARPDAIVNCAAYNNVDGAEDHPREAFELNAFAVRAMARAAERLGSVFVHYSTDFVFDGEASTPYSETDLPNPRSVYAASKLVGEWFAADAPRAYVLRVESLFGHASGGAPPKGSVESIINAMLAGRDVRVFEDRTVSPTYVVDAARATAQLLESAAVPGLYHCVNPGSCTWLELARELARILEVDARLVPVRQSEVTLRAARPVYCALSNDKLSAAGVTMPTWQSALERYAIEARART